jgi:hypothetical protein
MDGFVTAVTETDVQALQASQELETALVMQKGYVTYFFQDSDPQWLEQLKKYHTAFQEWLKKGRQWAETDKEREILNQLESGYIRYSYARDEVIKLYAENKKEEGLNLQKSMRGQFFQIMDLCRQYRSTYEQRLAAAREKIKNQAALINVIGGAGLDKRDYSGA